MVNLYLESFFSLKTNTKERWTDLISPQWILLSWKINLHKLTLPLSRSFRLPSFFFSTMVIFLSQVVYKKSEMTSLHSKKNVKTGQQDTISVNVGLIYWIFTYLPCKKFIFQITLWPPIYHTELYKL